MLDKTDLYPSRNGGEPGLIDRQDSVTYTLQVAGAPLSPKQLESYETNGFLCLDKLFDESELRQPVAGRLR